jgi:Lhr-like helicase
MRNDSILYTGQTSASRRAEKAELRKRDKAEKQAKLAPNAQVIVDLLDSERDQVITQLLSLINGSTPTEDVKSLIVSLNLYKQSMSNVKAKSLNILRRTNSDEEMTNESA